MYGNKVYRIDAVILSFFKNHITTNGWRLYIATNYWRLLAKFAKSKNGKRISQNIFFISLQAISKHLIKLIL